jgi:hypothetical protein
MSGVTIIGELLAAHTPLLEVVPSSQIKAGRLPDGIQLPALLVRTISVVERPTLKRGATVRTTERVSVAVRAASYREQRAVIGMVRKACAGKTGTIANVPRVSVLTAGTGPDAAGPGDSFEQTTDFRVAFDAQA